MGLLQDFARKYQKTYEVLKLILIVGALVYLFELSKDLFDYTQVNGFFVGLLVFGIYLFIINPLQKFGLSYQAETGIFVITTTVFVFYFFATVLYPRVLAEEEANAPCGANTMEFRCYSISKGACKSAWEYYESGCKTEAETNRAAPTKLVGGGVKKCVHRNFAKHMAFNQRLDQPGCRSFIDSLR